MISTAPLKSVTYKYFFVANLITYQAVWFMGVLGQGEFLALSLAIVVLHFLLSPTKTQDIKVVATIGAIGIAIDLVLTLAGIYQFNEPLFPLWLCMLWIAFALTFNHALRWLMKFPLPTQALLGLFGGSSSYVAGQQLGAVIFPLPLATTAIVIGIVWAIAMPLFCWLTKNFIHE